MLTYFKIYLPNKLLSLKNLIDLLSLCIYKKTVERIMLKYFNLIINLRISKDKIKIKKPIFVNINTIILFHKRLTLLIRYPYRSCWFGSYSY